MNNVRTAIVGLAVFLPVYLVYSQKVPEGVWFTENFIVSKPTASTLTVTTLLARQAYTNQFAGNVSNIEICASAGLVSFKCSGNPKGQFGLFDLESRTVLFHPMLTLDGDERRWSPSGQLAYVKLDDASFAILATSNLLTFLRTQSTNLCSLVVIGDRAGSVFQEDWPCDRFLIFGTGQGTEMSWGLLDTYEKSCYYLGSVGYKNGPKLDGTSRSPSRLRYLAAERVLYGPCVRATFCDFGAELRREMNVVSGQTDKQRNENGERPAR